MGLLDDAKEEIDALYELYYHKFHHKEPQKKQWYAIQMVSNVIELKKLKMIEEDKYVLLNL